MGGICGKPSSAVEQGRESPKVRQINKGAAVVSRRNSGRLESFRAKDKRENGDGRVGFVDKRTNSSRRVRDETIPRGVSSGPEAELIAAGWPSWLVGAAGESIKGWIPRRADTFEKLDKVYFSNTVIFSLFSFFFVCSLSFFACCVRRLMYINGLII